MPVFHEAPPLVQLAPGRLLVDADIVQAINAIPVPIMNPINPPIGSVFATQWATARGAAETLALLYRDALAELTNGAYWQFAAWPAAGPLRVAYLQDATDLIKLGYYIFDCALDPILLYRQFLINNAIPPLAAQPLPDAVFDADCLTITLCLTAMEAIVYNVAPAAVNAHPDHVALNLQRAAWNAAAGQVAGVPALGFMELLIRIMAESCNDLSKFSTVQQNLRRDAGAL